MQIDCKLQCDGCILKSNFAACIIALSELEKKVVEKKLNISEKLDQIKQSLETLKENE